MDFLFKKRDSRQLGLLRIVIGSWFLIDILSMLVSGYVKEAYVSPEMNFHFYGFDWIKPLPGIGMYILFVILALLAVGIITGYLFKWATSLFLLGFTYVFMCDIVYTLNKFYLFIILCFVLLFTQADRCLSLNSKKKREFVPAYEILIFQALIILIYTYSGISKLNADWLIHAEPLIFFFKHKIPFKWLSKDTYTFIVFGFTYGGVLFDLSISWLLINKRTNLFANIWQGLFHTLNFTTLFIGSLSIFMALLTWLLFPTPWLKKKFKFNPASIQDDQFSQRFNKSLVSSLVILFLAINLLIPFRHYFTGNNVNWTEKGHRFSWRLMTRSKNGSRASFDVINNVSGEKVKINPRKHLTRRQYRKMSAETDLVIVFAHYLKDKYTKIYGHSNISIYGNIQTRLNGRKTRPLISKSLDLAKVKRSILIDQVSLPFTPRED